MGQITTGIKNLLQELARLFPGMGKYKEQLTKKAIKNLL
jgi:hypothetical protein